MMQGLHVSSLRGMDATGVALVRDPGKPPLVYKKAMTGSDFIFQKKTRALMDMADQMLAVIGHNRSATLHGPGEDENAHPFTFDHITMVHNGHVHNYKDLEVDCSVQVDSAYVAKSLAENGEPATLEMIQGDFTLIWHNAKDKTLNMARNNKRPLYYVELPEWDGIAWASEYEMLAMLLSRNQIKMTGKFWQPKENIHFKFDLTQGLERKSFPFTVKYNQGGKHKTTVLTTIPKTEDETAGEDGIPTSEGMVWGSNKNLLDIIKKHTSTRKVSEWRIGRPSTDKQIARAKLKLNSLNLIYDNPVGMNLDTFIPYKESGKRGLGIGYLLGREGRLLTAEIPNLSEEDYWILGGDSGNKNWNTVRTVNVRYYEDKYAVVVVELDADFMVKVRRDADADLRAMGGSKSPALIYAGPGNKMVSEARFLQLTKTGCTYCHETLDRKEHKEIFWIDDSPVCPKCAGDGSIAEEMAILSGQGPRVNAVH